MKFVIAFGLFACALAAPQGYSSGDALAQVLRLDSDSGPEQGQFKYVFETSNGIREDREGYQGFEGQSNMRGSYSFPLPDGTFADFTYTADENGFRVQSPLLPPLPDFVREQIRFAEEQRRLGVVYQKK